jgi:peptide/nickel transport system permease protein
MVWYVGRRIAQGLLVLFVVSFLTFIIFFKLPSVDPARLITRKPTTATEYQLVRERLGLDRPFLEQYWRFAKGLIPLPGMFLNEEVYFSFQSNIPVREELARRAPFTLTLGVGGVVLCLLLAVPLGVGAGLRPRSWLDRLANGYVLVSISTPSFWFAALSLYVLWYRWGVAPPSGIPTSESWFEAVMHGRYVLPWITEAFVLGAIYVQLLRGEMIEAMSSDYVRTARAKGVPRMRITVRHGLRSSLTSGVTILAYDLAAIVTGAVFIEQVFNIPGIGRYTVEALRHGDLPAIMGTTVVFSVALVLVGIVVDITYAVIDPRVKLRGDDR